MAKQSYFAFKQFKVEQGQTAMKVTTDACLLGALFGRWLQQQPASTVLDIGAGTGLLSLMAAQNGAAQVTAVELDAEAAAQTRSNADASPWSQKIRVINAAIQSVEREAFDAIICNPPFFQDSTKNQDARKRQARHTDTLSFDALAQSIARLLKQDGQAWVILPPNESIALQRYAKNNGLQLTAQIQLRSTVNHLIHRTISVFQFNDAPVHERTLTIYDTAPHYNRATRELMQPYYLFL